MKYRYTQQKYEKIDGKWVLKENDNIGIVGEQEYKNITDKDVRQFFKRVFNSKEKLIKTSNGAIVTSELNNIKYVHTLESIGRKNENIQNKRINS